MRVEAGERLGGSARRGGRGRPGARTCGERGVAASCSAACGERREGRKGEKEEKRKRRKMEKEKEKEKERERKRESERALAIFAAATAGPVGHARCVVRSDGDAR